MVKYSPVIILMFYLAVLLLSHQETKFIERNNEIIKLQNRPQQTPATSSMVAYGEFKLVIKAHYKIAARVLQTERYYFDWLSVVSPIDLFLSWGWMSSVAEAGNALGHIYQSERSATYSVTAGVAAQATVNNHVANVHVIPLNSDISRYLLGKVKKYDLIYMEGDLVDVFDKQNQLIVKSSLVRGELSPGGCEVFLVKKIKHLREST